VYLLSDIIIPCRLRRSTVYVRPKNAIPTGSGSGVSVCDNSLKDGFELQY
jgi:hypothetical protein